MNYLLLSIINCFFKSATPNFFAANKRRKKKNELANTFKEAAKETQGEIDLLKSANPFESAAAKSAMTESSRRAKQTQERFANILGGNATPESIIAAQQASQESIANTAGDIATGAEANKASQLAQLRGEKENQLQQAAGIKMASIDEYGQGWKDFFSNLSSATNVVGNIAQGVGGAIGAM